MTEKRRSIFPLFLLAGGIILLLAGLVSVLVNRQPQAALTPTPATVEEVERVPLEKAKAAFDAGTAVFLDVRDSSSYESSHIQGAISIPSIELVKRMGELDRGAWIIPY